MIKIGALWEKVDKNGNPYFIGKFGDATLMIYSNGYKTEDKHPDKIVYIAEDRRSKEKNASESPRKGPNSGDSGGDIPF
jgi:hypothetical protein